MTWRSTVDQWNLDFAAVGLLAGAVGSAAATRHRWAAPAASAVVATAVLILTGTAPLGLAVGVAVALPATLLAPRRASLLRAVAVLVVVATLLDGPRRGWVLLAVIGLAAAFTVDAGSRRLPPGAPGLLLIAAGAACWLCVPDTEGVLVAGAACAAPALLALRAGRRGAGTEQARLPDWFPSALVLLWAAIAGFAGRPVGVIAVGVIAVAVAAWPASCRRSEPVPWMPLLVTGAAVAVVARTDGLATDPGRILWWSLSSLVVISALWVRHVRRSGVR